MNINTLHKKLVKRAGAAVAATEKAVNTAEKAGLLKTLAALLGKGKDKAVTLGKNHWQGVKNNWDDMLHAVTDEGKVDWGRRAKGAGKLVGKAIFPPAAAVGSYGLLKDPVTDLKDYVTLADGRFKEDIAREGGRIKEDFARERERFNKDLDRYKDLYEKFKKYDKKLTFF